MNVRVAGIFRHEQANSSFVVSLNFYVLMNVRVGERSGRGGLGGMCKRPGVCKSAVLRYGCGVA